MFSARDAYDDWYDDDEPYADVGSSSASERYVGAEPRRYRDSSPRLSVVRSPSAAFALVRPTDFESAPLIADNLRDGASVLVDLGGCDRALTGRLTDFASGLVYALGAGLQQVGDKVILLTPGHLTVSGDETSDVRAPGFYNRI